MGTLVTYLSLNGVTFSFFSFYRVFEIMLLREKVSLVFFLMQASD